MWRRRTGGQGIDLLGGERPDGPGRQAVEVERSDPDPDEAPDAAAHGREHPPELPLPAGLQDDPVPDRLAAGSGADESQEAAGLGRRRGPDPDGPGEPVGEDDAGEEPFDLRPVEPAIDGDGVLPLDPEPGMEDPLGPGAVVREEDEPLGFPIEPPDREDAAPGEDGRRNEIEDGPGGEPIADGRGDAGRLVEGEVDRGCRDELDRSAVDGHSDAGRVDPLPEDRRSAVDLDATGGDEGVDGPP